MSGILTRAGVPIPDYPPTEASTFASSPFDKIDVTAFNGDVRLQYLTPQLGWQPAEGQVVRRGNFRSIPGLSEMFPPGPTMVRFWRANVGVAATIDVDLYSPDA